MKYIFGFIVLLFGINCGANTISIINPSFEDSPLNEGNWIAGNTFGWSANNATPQTGAGVFNPIDNTLFNSIPDGNNIAWVNKFGRFEQVLSEKLEDKKLYTLTGQVGRRSNITKTGVSYSMALMAGNYVLAKQEGNLTDIPSGGWTEHSLKYDSGLSTMALGEQLRIVLTSSDVQSNFDNFDLTAVASIPLPASLYLFITALACFAALQVRSKQ